MALGCFPLSIACETFSFAVLCVLRELGVRLLYNDDVQLLFPTPPSFSSSFPFLPLPPPWLGVMGVQSTPVITEGSPSVLEPPTPGSKCWSWRRSSTLIATWPGGAASRSPTRSACPSARSRSGFRTGGWSGRKITNCPTLRCDPPARPRPQRARQGEHKLRVHTCIPTPTRAPPHPFPLPYNLLEI